MRKYLFKLVNVFAESHFTGNPLAVFPQADGLTDQEMQQIAKQFNLSETVFAFSAQSAVANLRIFTPEYELPLAGHPTLGCAYVLQKLHDLSPHFILNTQVKPVQIQIENDRVEMMLSDYEIRPSQANQQQLAKAVGLTQEMIMPTAYWVNSGSPQLLLQLNHRTSIDDINIDSDKLAEICQQENEHIGIYLWYEDKKCGQIFSRFFYAEKGVILEDSGTGSAAANLGAYFLSQQQFPANYIIHQGDKMGRPNRISLRLDEQQHIYIGGRIIEIGEGYLNLP
ncbi:PhzF family phenazine biosynthesis protein [Pasteurellaceae bacterium 22721_9_1]